ncbi:MAG: hypothetical protein ABT02_00105 [Comamonadaceae bacterium SCN 68-20]|nr:MAG: hypothetical protein ABT02_00105 [Comamonadaceae bacterium SCN 68-20]OJX11972.1 MAG: hypothetical protein BGO75_14120 [Burkholderiales bacterium 68-20]
MTPRIIHIEPAAPPKPARGAPCNGCGLCCLAEPCPLGMLLSRRRTGTCVALQWNAAAQCYRCGALAGPAGKGVRGVGGALWHALARRWIGAGLGCDADLAAFPAENAPE